MTRGLQLVRRAGRTSFLGYGMATAGLRPRPDFVVIGAKRGGTTSLYRYLGEHPQVLPLFPSARFLPMMGSDQKGTHFLDALYPRGERWWRAHFPTAAYRRLVERGHGRPTAVGEGCPYHLFHPHSPARAAAHLPDARFIALLREPVQRTWSHWKEQRRNGIEPLDFADALAAEPARLAGEEARLLADPSATSFAHEHQSYAAQSEYAAAILRWRAHVPPERLLILTSEELYADPQATYARVVAFLGLAPHRLRAPQAWNSAGAPPVDAGILDGLAQRFEPGVRELQDVLGRTPIWER